MCLTDKNPLSNMPTAICKDKCRRVQLKNFCTSNADITTNVKSKDQTKTSNAAY